MSASLAVEDVVRSFGGVRAVDGATLAVEPGSITGLIGPNGAGKSTLFNCISGFLRPQAGRVLLDGKRIDRRPAHRIARAGLVRTFQTPRALTRMTVLENVVLAAPRHPGERLGRRSRRGARAASARRGRAPPSCSSSCASTVTPTRSPARSPAVSASCSTSCAR